MNSKYYEWNECLCEQLCEHMAEFKECPNVDCLCIIEKLTKTINNLQEMEAAGAMRKYVEEKFGYDSRTGEFSDRDRYDDWAGWTVYNYGGSRGGRPYYPTTSTGYTSRGDRGSDRGNDTRYGEQRSTDRSMMRDGYERAERGDMRDGREMGMDVRNGMGRGVYNTADKEEAKKHMKLTDKEKEEWAEMLEDESGSTGPTFSKEEVSSIAKKMGITYDEYQPIDLWLMTNVMVSDHFETAKKMNVNKPEFYVSLAKEWLEDVDSVSPEKKIAYYYHNIVDRE